MRPSLCHLTWGLLTISSTITFMSPCHQLPNPSHGLRFLVIERSITWESWSSVAQAVTDAPVFHMFSPPLCELLSPAPHSPRQQPQINDVIHMYSLPSVWAQVGNTRKAEAPLSDRSSVCSTALLLFCVFRTILFSPCSRMFSDLGSPYTLLFSR